MDDVNFRTERCGGKCSDYFVCSFVCMSCGGCLACTINRDFRAKVLEFIISKEARERERERESDFSSELHAGSPKTGSMNSRAGSSAAQERIYIKLEIHTLRVR